MRDVLEDPEQADEIEDEGLEDYAVRRKIQLLNPRFNMAKKKVPTVEELQDRIDELEEENQGLQDQLDEIAAIVAPAEEEEEEESDEGEDRD